MPNQSVRVDGVREQFETEGPSWSERARCGELNSVLSPTGTERQNRFLHSAHVYGAKVALPLIPEGGVVLDFGCGTGRFIRFFGGKGYSIIGIDTTPNMLSAARDFGLPKNSLLLQGDGITIPVRDESLDVIWVCAVLKYSLFIVKPVYREIAEEMYRVLKPGGYVVNAEMYVEAAPEAFTSDFEQVGFRTKEVRLLRRNGLLEALSQSSLVPTKCIASIGQFCARLRFRFANPNRVFPGVRDYLFVWSKPSA